MSSAKTMVSNTYFPGSGMAIKMNNIDDDPRNQQHYEETNAEDEESCIVQPGLSDAWTNNKLYKSLIIEAGINDLENEEIVNAVSKHVFGDKLS